MSTTWIYQNCGRQVARTNQRHACGTGDRSEVLLNRPETLVALYTSFESFAKKLGPIEFVTRKRYVLLRSNRIFADLVVMGSALRMAVHLTRRVSDPFFPRPGNRSMSHMVKISHIMHVEDNLIRTALKVCVTRDGKDPASFRST